MSDVFCLKWANFQEHMVRAVQDIFQSHQYTDCRLVVPEGELCANRAVLCMASRFFEIIFAGTMNSEALGTDRLMVIIPDLKLLSLRYVLQFIYTGEVYLRPQDVAPFVEACSLLQIRGAPCCDDGSVEIKIGTFISSIADNNVYETTAYLANDCRQEEVPELRAPERDERSDALTVKNESVKFLCQEMSFGEKSNDESSSPDYSMENEENNATVQKLLHEVLEGASCRVENSTDGILNRNVEQNQKSTISSPNERLNDNVPECTEHIDPSSYETRLNAAVDAIINHNISYRMASQQYKIAKTVLWRKTMKMSRLVRPTSPQLANQRREAIAALKSGEKLINVSQRFEIPLSTLHRDKIRLYKKGVLPIQVTLKQRDKGESFRQRLTEAVSECIAGRMSLSEAARVYELPKTSIWRKVRSSQPNYSRTDVKAMERNVSKCDNAVQNLEQCVGTVEEDAGNTVGDLLSATYQNLDVSAAELTHDSIIL